MLGVRVNAIIYMTPREQYVTHPRYKITPTNRQVQKKKEQTRSRLECIHTRGRRHTQLPTSSYKTRAGNLIESGSYLPIARPTPEHSRLGALSRQAHKYCQEKTSTSDRQPGFSSIPQVARL